MFLIYFSGVFFLVPCTIRLFNGRLFHASYFAVEKILSKKRTWWLITLEIMNVKESRHTQHSYWINQFHRKVNFISPSYSCHGRKGIFCPWKQKRFFSISSEMIELQWKKKKIKPSHLPQIVYLTLKNKVYKLE